MTSSLSKREINRQRWFEHIQEWKQSGLTQKAYCERHHLGTPSLQRWQRIFSANEQATSAKRASPVTFVPVNIIEPDSSGLVLWINDNLRIEIPSHFDEGTLKRLVQVLQAS